MGSNFPLYENLYLRTEDRELTDNEYSELLKRVNKLEQRDRDFIYVLIKIHAQKYQENYKNYTLPYHAVYVKEGISFDLTKFPPRLKQIIYHFLLTQSSQQD